MTHDWLKIKTNYFTNRNQTLEDTANKFGVPLGYLYDVAAKEKWRNEKENIWGKSEEKMVERMPDKIADIKLRHAQIGRIMQSKVIELIKDGKITSKSTYSDMKTAVDIERDALGLNDKKTNEETQQLSQYNFIVNLKPDELRRFVKSVERRRTITSGSDSEAGIVEANESGGNSEVGTAELSR